MNKFLKEITDYSEYNKLSGTNKEFIGSQPIQLQKENITRIIDTNVLLTPKLDGVRYLMVVGKSEIQFMDRGNKLYKLIGIPGVTFNNKTIYLLDTEVCLVDGRLQIYVFDIFREMKGQADPNRLDNMLYRKRNMNLFNLFQHDQLFHRMNENINVHNIFIYFKANLTFNNFGMSGNDFYEYVKREWIKFMKLEHVPEFDGIIFINSMYKYNTKTIAYGQYKWKPRKDLTIDLNYSGGKLYKREKGEDKGKLETFKSWKLSKKPNSDGVWEFKLEEGKKLTPLREREKNANSEFTLRSVLKSIEEPVDLNDINRLFMGGLDPNAKISIKLIKWMSENKAKQFFLLFGGYEGYSEIVPKEDFKKQFEIFTTKNENFYIKPTKTDIGNLMRIDILAETNNEEFIYDNIKEEDEVQTFLQRKKWVIELNKKYDSGFSQNGNKDELIMERIHNLGEKTKDIEHVIYKMTKVYNIKPVVYYETEYIRKYPRTGKQTRYLYISEENIEDLMTDIRKMIKPKILSNDVIESFGIFGKQTKKFEKIFNDYTPNINLITSKDIRRVGLWKFSDPESNEWLKSHKISRKRYKKKYYFEFNTYFKLCITRMKQKILTSNKNWVEEHKDFIELELKPNFKDFEEEQYKQEFMTAALQLLKYIF